MTCFVQAKHMIGVNMTTKNILINTNVIPSMIQPSREKKTNLRKFGSWLKFSHYTNDIGRQGSFNTYKYQSQWQW